MNKKISFIIPCYNCAETVEDAVSSVYKQNLDNFEIIMVDDCSSDNTKNVLKSLSEARAEIKVICNDTNRGGGASRNIAIKESVGEIIVLLDSDDLLPDNTTGTMVKFLLDNECDGVVYNQTLFFENNDTNNLDTKDNQILNRPITVHDLFKKDSGFLTRVNFVFTKSSFLKTKGYPENHGFDTQCFGYRFLFSGNKVMVCPGTGYLHRRNSGTTYFIREYNQGKLSFNNYLIFEEFLFQFSKQIREKILNFDIFSKNYLGENNLENYLYNCYEKGPDMFFNEKHNEYLNPNGSDMYIDNINPAEPTDLFCLAINKRLKGLSDEALKILLDNKKHLDRFKLYQLNVYLCSHNLTETFEKFRKSKLTMILNKIKNKFLKI